MDQAYFFISLAENFRRSRFQLKTPRAAPKSRHPEPHGPRPADSRLRFM